MRIMHMVLIVVVAISGYTSELNLEKAAALTKVWAQVPKCTGNLETINEVVKVKGNTEQGLTVIIRQDCEPKHGEGPQMRTNYTYVVTPKNEVQFVDKNGL